MKITFVHWLTLSLILLIMPSGASAQTIMNNTTLAAAITTPSASNPTPGTSINLTTLTPTTGTTQIAAGHFVYIENELMQVSVTPTAAANVQVRRGVSGTIPRTHPSAARVYIVEPALYVSAFINVDPPWGSTCVRNQQLILPIHNINTGVTWTCGALGNSASSSLNWKATSTIPTFTYNSAPVGLLGASPPAWAALSRLLDRFSAH